MRTGSGSPRAASTCGPSHALHKPRQGRARLDHWLLDRPPLAPGRDLRTNRHQNADRQRDATQTLLDPISSAGAGSSARPTDSPVSYSMICKKFISASPPAQLLREREDRQSALPVSRPSPVPDMCPPLFYKVPPQSTHQYSSGSQSWDKKEEI